LGSEGIKENVGAHEQQTNNFCFRIGIGSFAVHGKDGHTNGNQQGLDVLSERIRGSLEQSSHAHDWNNFGTFEYRLDWKGHVLERSILTPAGHGIAEGTGRKGQEWCNIVGKKGSLAHSDGNEGHNNGQETVAKDAKGGTGKFTTGYTFGGGEDGRHDQFLHVPPGQVGCLQTTKTQEKFEGLFEEFGIVGKEFINEIVYERCWRVVGMITHWNIGFYHKGFHLSAYWSSNWEES